MDKEGRYMIKVVVFALTAYALVVTASFALAYHLLIAN